MAAYVVSPRAAADIDDIWDYSAEQWGEDRANRYVTDIRYAIERVAADPRKGRPVIIRSGYRKYPVGSHVIFFRLVPIGIDVVRVLHQRMDFERHL
jgi:toxin ParE1/3/4